MNIQNLVTLTSLSCLLSLPSLPNSSCLAPFSRSCLFVLFYNPLILTKTLCMIIQLGLGGAWWAHPRSQHWSQWPSFLQNLQAVNSSAEGMGLWELLPAPWWTNSWSSLCRPSGSNQPQLLWEHESNGCHYLKVTFQSLLPHLLALTSFPFPFPQCSEPYQGWYKVSLRPSTQSLLILSTWSSHKSLHLVTAKQW